MTTDVALLASSMIGDGLSPSPYKEWRARAELAEARLAEVTAERDSAKRTLAVVRGVLRVVAYGAPQPTTQKE